MSEQKFTFYSGVSVKEKHPFQHLYIYHVPKTGTLSVFTAVRTSVSMFLAGLRATYPEVDRINIDRFDSEDFLDGRRLEGEYGLVASHLPWGFHEKFNQNFSFVTVLREPYKRVLSAYTYHCMRSHLKPSLTGFQKHFRDQLNQNVSTRQLAGYRQAECVPKIAVEIAKHNLERRFAFYGTSAQTTEVISGYLSWSGLPNVISGRLNQTKDEYKIDGSEFKEEILALNSLDLELYEYVEQNSKPVPPGIVIGEKPPHEWTVLIHEAKNDLASQIQVKAIQTALVEGCVQDGVVSQGDFEQLFETANFFQMK